MPPHKGSSVGPTVPLAITSLGRYAHCINSDVFNSFCLNVSEFIKTYSKKSTGHKNCFIFLYNTLKTYLVPINI